MTDEQRQQLIRDLNAVANAPRYGGACSVCKEAAEEIERLTTLLEWWKQRPRGASAAMSRRIVREK
jgi:hypothetical protein